MSRKTPSRRRMAACLLYEFLVIFAIGLIGFLIPQVVLYGFGMQAPGKQLWGHLFLLLAAYFIWCWIHGGQTLPMKTWKLRLADESGAPLRPMQALLRYCAAWLSLLLLGLGFLWAYIDPKQQSWHDKIAGSRLYFEENKAE